MTKTALLHISIIQRPYDHEPSIHFSDRDMSDYYRRESEVFFRLLEVREIDLPSMPEGDDLTGAMIEALEERKESVQNKARRDCREIDERIANLRSLTHQPEGESDA